MEPPRTPHTTEFSPWEAFESVDPATLTALGYQVHQTSVSLEDLIAAVEEAVDARAEAEPDSEDDGSEWEELDSRAPSPVDCCRSPGSSDASPPSTSVTASADLPDPDMPPLVAPAKQRSPRDARTAQYDKLRRQRRRQQHAASPFTRIPHPKSLPTHRLLSPKETDFDARDFSTTKGGHWLGKRQPPPRSRTKAKNKKKNAKERVKAQCLRELHELLDELEHQYLCWDGK